MMNKAPFTINDSLAEFLEQGHPAQVGTRNAFNKTAITRSWGCQVQPDRQSVMLFLPQSYLSPALQNIRDNGYYAAFFINVFNYETYQLKGSGATIQNDISPYLSLLELYYQRQRDLVDRLGLPAIAADNMFAESFQDFVPVHCPVTSCYNQTPGAGAGKKVQD